MTAKKLFLFCFLMLCQILSAQQDSIVLKEVLVFDFQLKNFSNTQSLQKLNDTIIGRNQSSLTSLLNYNSVIYFKENGLGMVSSPSFRGTTAQQTAVVWNGININSQLNGQTDFNTITTRDFSDISVRSGGGSIIYGSSAIGGSIHLNNDLRFKKRFENEIRLNYGSFNTFGGNYKLSASNAKTTVNLSISRNSSDNDYDYLDTENLKNENGQFYNTSVNLAFGYKINKANVLKLYSQVFESERHFSGTLVSPSQSKYQDLNTRNLLEWTASNQTFISSARVAFLSEKYKYFANANTEKFETAKAETFIAKYDLNWKISSKININSIVDYTQTKGIGSNIGEETRSIGSAVLLFKHQLFQKLQYEFSFRKELTNAYQSPLLFAFGTKWKASEWYAVKLNVSRNFRIPTFNDLYWQGSGNPDLKPESSYQAEIGQELTLGNFVFSATAYYMKIENLLRWTPMGNNWAPENVGKVNGYGAEGYLKFTKKIGSHAICANVTYAYTVSENEKLGKQLTYVPYHKFNADFAYSYQKFTVNYQHLFTGQIFTLADESDFLKAYHVSNAGIDYDFGSKNKYSIGFQALNIWNENYQSMPHRPMPGRNYNIHLTLKF